MGVTKMTSICYIPESSNCCPNIPKLLLPVVMAMPLSFRMFLTNLEFRKRWGGLGGYTQTKLDCLKQSLKIPFSCPKEHSV